MIRSVTVIARDSVVVVGGLPLHFTLPAHEGILYLNWCDGKGTVVYANDTPSRQFDQSEYTALAAPFVAAWDVEKQRRGDPLGDAKAAKLAEIVRGYQTAFAPIEAIYPQAEREGWPMQEAEARAVYAEPGGDPATLAPVLSLLVQLRSRGETVPDMAAKVLANAGQWRMLYAALTGQQQRMYADVAALTTVEEVQAYHVAYQMPE